HRCPAFSAVGIVPHRISHFFTHNITMPLRVPARAARGRFLTEGRRKLAAVMFTDMVGYTLLGQKNEQLSVALAREQRRLIRPLLARHGGREVKTMGDSFLVVFTNALDAVRCAYDIQRAVREFNFSVAGETQIHLRIGVHLGDVVEARGDIAGDAVNLASRVEGQAADGGVCLTQQVYDQVLNKFELPLVSMGARSLKNVVRPVELYSVEMPWTRAAPTPAAAPSRQRIAILPFANFSPDPGDDYFADGMTDEIISKVSGISGLSVISRTSAMGYKGTSKNVKVIGQELEVGSILEGSLRKVGNRIRVAAQLIDVTGDRHVWSQNYEKELDDVFAVQSDVAQKIAESMEVSLLESERTNIRRIPTKSLSAYESYLQGLYLFNKGRSASVQASIECLEGAIRLDPKFSQAYAALGNIYVASAGEQMPLREAFAKAEQMIAAALRLDPDCS
ncbi:MAG TPA: adenylate/guanylate cyclase domain-containing protein, partial [Nitrososphaerales archaeon]|nr:adenylate/guanylate cyclase domain-containing protein [Nitrososphaerales archaeon]